MSDEIKTNLEEDLSRDPKILKELADLKNTEIDVTGTVEEEEQTLSIEAEYEQELKKVQSETEEAKPENDKVVDEAKHFGHLSKDEWVAQGKDPLLWKSPEEFVSYGKQFKNLVESLKEQNKAQSEKIDILVREHKTRAEQAVQQAKKELQIQLHQAKLNGDTQAVEQLAKQQTILDIEAQQQLNQRIVQERQQVDQIFTERNKHWFNAARPDLLQKVQYIASEIDSYYPNITYAEKARRIEERIKFEHPETSMTVPQSAPAVHMSSSNINKSEARHGGNDTDRAVRSLSAEQRAEFNTVKNQLSRSNLGIEYTVKDYLEFVKKNG